MGVVARVKWAQFVELATAPCFVVAGAWMAGLNHGSLWSGALGLFVCWPLAEWWLHRSLLHRLLRKAHWHHHEDPMSDIHVTPFLPDVVMLALFGLFVLIGGRAIGGGFFAGLVLGLIFVAWREYRDTAVRSERDLWAFTKLPTLGVISLTGGSGDLEPKRRLFGGAKPDLPRPLSETGA